MTRETSTAEKICRWLVPAALIAFASGAIYVSTTFRKMPAILKRGIQPSDFPQLVCALIIALTILMIWKDPIRLSERVTGKAWATMASMLGFVALTQIDLFLALGATALFIAALWGEKRPAHLALVGIAAPGAVFFLFDLVFRVRFPRGLLTSAWYG